MNKKTKPEGAAEQLRDPRSFVVKVDRLYWPSDDAELRRLIAGDEIPLSARSIATASLGEIVRGQLPAVSTEKLLEVGAIDLLEAEAEKGGSL